MFVRMRRAGWKAAAGLAAVVAAAVMPGALATASARNRAWYRRLRKPAWTPPDAIFGPVWTALYALMTASAWRVWRAPASAERSRALAWWGAQLAANGAWTPLFFGAHRPRLALADLGLLLGALGLYVREARRVDRGAAWMMAPYGAWSLFAAGLNGAIVRRGATA